MMNEKEMKYLNYDKKQTCKGRKIAVFEYTTSKYLKELTNVIQPFKMGYNLYEDKEFSHGFKVCSLVSKYLKDAIIYLLPPNDQGIQFCIDNDIEFVNFSGGNLMASDVLEKELSKKAVLFTSAGNGYGKKEQFTALNKDWIAVGAVEFDSKGEIVVPSYQSYGAGAIRTTSFSGIRFHETYGDKVYGTSFSSPLAMIINAQYKSNYADKYGVELSADYLRSVIYRDSEDILEYFKDKKSGYGIYKLTDV